MDRTNKTALLFAGAVFLSACAKSNTSEIRKSHHTVDSDTLMYLDSLEVSSNIYSANSQNPHEKCEGETV